MQPEILSARPAPSGQRIKLRVPENLDCFTGHFPGLPVLPGVMQMDWTLQLAGTHLNLPPDFTHVSALKFMRVIEPGAKLSLDLDWDGARRELSFSYHDAAGEISSGRIGFAAAHHPRV